MPTRNKFHRQLCGSGGHPLGCHANEGHRLSEKQLVKFKIIYCLVKKIFFTLNPEIPLFLFPKLTKFKQLAIAAYFILLHYFIQKEVFN